MMTQQTKNKVTKLGVTSGLVVVFTGIIMCIFAIALGEDLNMGTEWMDGGIVENVQEDSLPTGNEATQQIP